MKLINWRRDRLCALLLTSAVCGGVFASTEAPEAPPTADKQESKGPVVKVITPTTFGYIVGHGTGWGSRRILIGIEITDRSGAGIESSDSGVPRFVNSNDNVDAFARHIDEKGSYTNSLGQTVLQLFGEIPVSRLKTHDSLRVSPPLSEDHLRPEDFKQGIVIPDDEALPAAVFAFEVRDLQGRSSKESTDVDDASKAFVAFTDALYKPPAPTRPEVKTGVEPKAPPSR